MVKVTVIDDLLDKQSMSELVNKVGDILEDTDDYDLLSEGLLWHSQARKTLPKNETIRKAILALKLNKNFKDVSGYDLYKVTVNNTLRKDIENRVIEVMKNVSIKELQDFSTKIVWNVLKNYKYGNFSESDFIKTIFIFLNWIEPAFHINECDINQKVALKVSSLISNWDINKVKNTISLSTALSKIGEETRIKAYRLIIAKLIKLK